MHHLGEGEGQSDAGIVEAFKKRSNYLEFRHHTPHCGRLAAHLFLSGEDQEIESTGRDRKAFEGQEGLGQRRGRLCRRGQPSRQKKLPHFGQRLAFHDKTDPCA